MRKMIINGITCLWTNLSWSNPDNTVGCSIMVAYPENDPRAAPIFLIDNNGENLLGGFSHAVWMPTQSVQFVEPGGLPVTWEQPEPLHQCQQNGCISLMTKEYLMEVPDGFVRVWLCQTDATPKNNLIEMLVVKKETE